MFKYIATSLRQISDGEIVKVYLEMLMSVLMDKARFWDKNETFFWGYKNTKKPLLHLCFHLSVSQWRLMFNDEKSGQIT
jgi:hypothetical protein